MADVVGRARSRSPHQSPDQGEAAIIKEEKSVIIRRPFEEVFAYVGDLRHSAEWQAGLSEVRKVTEGPLRVGTRFTVVRKLLG